MEQQAPTPDKPGSSIGEGIGNPLDSSSHSLKDFIDKATNGTGKVGEGWKDPAGAGTKGRADGLNQGAQQTQATTDAAAEQARRSGQQLDNARNGMNENINNNAPMHDVAQSTLPPGEGQVAGQRIVDQTAAENNKLAADAANNVTKDPGWQTTSNGIKALKTALSTGNTMLGGMDEALKYGKDNFGSADGKLTEALTNANLPGAASKVDLAQKVLGASPASLSQKMTDAAAKNFATEAEGLAGKAGMLGSKALKSVPVVGTGLTAASGVADWMSGTPADVAAAKAGGSVVGGAVGTAAGAALGSFVPVVGTSIGGFLGGMAGSALGSWVGEKMTE